MTWELYNLATPQNKYNYAKATCTSPFSLTFCRTMTLLRAPCHR